MMVEHPDSSTLRLLEQRVQALESDIFTRKKSFSEIPTKGACGSIIHPTSKHIQPNCASALKILRRHVEDFWNNISLPGFKYVGEPGRHRSDRYIWILVLFLSLLVSSRYIQDAYKKWQGSPVLLTFNDSLTPIALIPFPAITFCPARRLQDEVSLQKIFDNCRKDNCTDEDKDILTSARLLCPESVALNENGTDFYEGSLEEPLQQVSVDCEDVLKWFKFGTETTWYYNVKNHTICSDFFQKVYRDNGRICFAYNMLPRFDLFKDGV